MSETAESLSWSLEGIREPGQHDAVYAAEAAAALEWWCFEEPHDLAAMQDLADRCLEWAKGELGVRSDLTVGIELGTDGGDLAAEVTKTAWTVDGPRTEVRVYRTGDPGWVTDHLILHEMAHVITGKWSGGLPHPDPHGPLFTRRHLDLVAYFHPGCYVALVNAYDAHGVKIADYDAEPGSWWDVPTAVVPEVVRVPALSSWAAAIRRFARRCV